MGRKSKTGKVSPNRGSVPLDDLKGGGEHWQKILSGWQAERRTEEKNPCG